MTEHSDTGVDPLTKIEHIIVLMLENRSFENLLGWLYENGEGPHGRKEVRIAEQIRPECGRRQTTESRDEIDWILRFGTSPLELLHWRGAWGK